MEKIKNVVVDITSDVAEVVLDSIADEGLLADLPVVGCVVKAARVSNTISDKILLKKIEAFLYNFKDLPEAEKQIMQSRLKNEEGRERIGEKLMLVLESADDLTKAELLGKCFRKYLERAFSKDELLRSWHAIDKCFLEDLRFLKNYAAGETSTQGNLTLANAGFIYNDAALGSGNDQGMFKLSDMGKEFYDVILKQ